jgi:hypothetical protein
MESCSKDDNNTVPPVVDTSTARLPKQVILTDPISDPLTPIKNYAIKYDTSNLTIGIYYDDLNNSNPYDKLLQEYKYNSNGYLISKRLSPGEVEEISYGINRSSDDKVIWISHNDNLNNTKDTSFFTYEGFSDSTRIHVNKHLALPVTGIEQTLYTYDKGNRIARAELQGGRTIQTYTYNTNGSLGSKVSQSSNTGGSYSVTLSYASADATVKGDTLKMVLLGRDYYLDDINNFYPFYYNTQAFSYPLTYPYDISRSIEEYIFPGSGSPKQYYFLSQTRNSKNRLTKMNVAETLNGNPLVSMQLIY